MRKILKLAKDKRAITPVLSNLLLTVVAVAAMALATSATYVITSNMRENMSERMIIEDVWFDSVNGNIKIYLYNIGKVAVHVSGVYVNRTSRSFTRPYDLEVKQHGWLNISQNWVSGSIYYLDVVTTRGTHVGDYYEAP